MSELFWNKIAGAVLGTFLMLFVVNEAGHLVYHAHEAEDLAYPIDVEIDTADATATEEEGPVDFGALLRQASVSAGENVARKCVACHTFEQGGADGVGPHLWDVMGRPAGAVEGFRYSTAMAGYENVWGYQNMYDYLERPQAYIRGTAMSFAGLSDQEDRINVIAYMRSLSESPLALPDPLAAATDGSDAAIEPEAAVEPAEETL